MTPLHPPLWDAAFHWPDPGAASDVVARDLSKNTRASELSERRSCGMTELIAVRGVRRCPPV
jgi:hypothetical protein